MALTATEILSGGFVRDKNTGALVVTTNTLNAVQTGGFLKDPDGRLVVVVG